MWAKCWIHHKGGIWSPLETIDAIIKSGKKYYLSLDGVHLRLYTNKNHVVPRFVMNVDEITSCRCSVKKNKAADFSFSDDVSIIIDSPRVALEVMACSSGERVNLMECINNIILYRPQACRVQSPKMNKYL